VTDQPRALVLTGTGINCEAETAEALRRAGGAPEIVHVGDLLEAPKRLFDFQMFVVPGGFAYGDDTGSGNALAHRLRHGLGDLLREFVERERLVLGVCNGFQVLVNLGLLPGFADGGGDPRQVVLLPNRPAGYRCRWVDVLVERPSRCPFVRGLESMHIPVGHGEGRFHAEPEVIARLEAERHVVLRYASGGRPAGGAYPANPNGSTHDIAGICDATGRVFGLMPHPERGMDFTQRDDWPRAAEMLRRRGEAPPLHADGLAVYAAAVASFRG
jgi:phosphoribosylformylglycinamidine synthase subunit PurQ / glutaminase